MSAIEYALPARHFDSSSAAYFSRSPRIEIQNRATAIAGSTSYCSKNIHWSTRARSSGSSGRYGVPSARYQAIAYECPGVEAEVVLGLEMVVPPADAARIDVQRAAHAPELLDVDVATREQIG